jgi:hypothetical protein
VAGIRPAAAPKRTVKGPGLVNPQEMVRVQNYMRKLFGSKTLSVRARPKIKDSAEVYVGDDFVGTLTVDNEDGELCYQFQMAILELDLED